MEYANELTTKFDSIIDATLTNYEAATARFDEAINLIRLAQDHAKQAGYDYYLSRLGYELKPEQYNKELTKNVWRELINKTGITTLMDSQTRQQMESDLEKNPPELTRENIRTILFDLYNRKDEILADSLINVFRSLTRRYKSNDKIKLTGKRIIIPIGQGFGRCSSHTDKLTDLDRIFHFLDGKKEPTVHRETLGYRAAYGDEFEIENDYFRIRIYMNGNAHIYFKRLDLVDQCNRLIAYHNKNRLGKA